MALTFKSIASYLVALAVLTAAQPSQMAHAQTVELKPKTLAEKNDSLRYEISADYPFIASDTATAQGFNKIAEKIATENVTLFKETVGTTPPPADFGSSLEMSYQTFQVNDEIVSVRFGVGAYIAGAAHGSFASRVLNWDYKNNKALLLEDLFKPKSSYLRTIASFCTAALRKQKRLVFPAGARANAENYANWNLTSTGLLITFDPYQVGPWAQGGSECAVPFRNIRVLLREPARWGAK